MAEVHDPGQDGRPLGFILAGGRASRLGGGDKMLRLVGGRTILAHIVERIAPQCAGLVLGANGPPARLPDWTGAVVADHPEDAGRGPLAGLLAGLDWAAEHRPATRRVLTVPSDTPFLPWDLAMRLQEGAGEDGVAFARSAGRGHPLAALWPVTLRHALRDMVRSEGMRRATDLVDRLVAVPVDWAATPADPFLNVNTTEDLAAAEAVALGRP